MVISERSLSYDKTKLSFLFIICISIKQPWCMHLFLIYQKYIYWFAFWFFEPGNDITHIHRSMLFWVFPLPKDSKQIASFCPCFCVFLLTEKNFRHIFKNIFSNLIIKLKVDIKLHFIKPISKRLLNPYLEAPSKNWGIIFSNSKMDSLKCSKTVTKG